MVRGNAGQCAGAIRPFGTPAQLVTAGKCLFTLLFVVTMKETVRAAISRGMEAYP